MKDGMLKEKAFSPLNRRGGCICGNILYENTLDTRMNINYILNLAPHFLYPVNKSRSLLLMKLFSFCCLKLSFFAFVFFAKSV